MTNAARTAAVLVLLGTPALAQTPGPTIDTRGFEAGDVLVRLRAIGVVPETSSSSVSAIGGHVDVTPTPAPEIDFSYFLTNHIAAELIVASTRHEVSAVGTSLGHVDVGSTYILPPTLTAQYHLMPRGRIDPYVGVGVTVAFWYDTNPAGGAVTKLGLRTDAGPAIQAGLNVALGGPWFANVDVKQIFLDTEARLDGGAIVAKTALDPTVVGAGVGYRF